LAALFFLRLQSLKDGEEVLTTPKAPKRDGDHGCPCHGEATYTQPKKGHAMIPAIFLLGLATGMALTTAFALGLLPLLLI
jgi:hypothetical protein